MVEISDTLILVAVIALLFIFSLRVFHFVSLRTYCIVALFGSLVVSATDFVIWLEIGGFWYMFGGVFFGICSLLHGYLYLKAVRLNVR